VKTEERLRQLGLELPEPARPVANYVPAVRAGKLVFVSGQLCLVKGEVTYRGKVGAELTVEQGYEAARLATLNALAVLRAELGDLDRVRRVVRVFGAVNSAPGFNRQPQVVNGASDLLVEVFGEAGRHARTAVGVSELPMDSAVEVELTVEVD
jgi:enamine deaminase RidA (YjgF/YER057c/UK114 family)